MPSRFADAIDSIGKYEYLDVVDLYNKSRISQRNLIKYKRLKNQQTGAYPNYSYPSFADIPLNPSTDEYPYPVEAINMTYDGLHPSDKGYTVIAKMLVQMMKKY